ncbi:MAG TPA: hypothetical protein VGK25_11550 [Ignavibacteria bacterium]|jgi:hypothetical protein
MKRIVTIFFVLLVTINLFSNERKFSYTYESGVLGKGNKELEIWSTVRIGKDIPYFARLDHRMEFEVGVSDRLQTAFYINFRNVSVDNGSGLTTSFDFQGISSEWKYQFSRPAKDPIGFALYSEIGLNTDEAELEAKLIFDKRISKNTFALNFVFENEWEFSSGEAETETVLEADFGWCYNISSSFSAGIEVRNHNEIVESEWEHSALFAGPVFSYNQPSWWATLTILPQITALKGKTGTSSLVLDEHEKLETRLLFSFRL